MEDQYSVDHKEAILLFEMITKKSVVQIERCSIGIANYVFIVSTAIEKFILRCSKDEQAYKDTVYWLNKLSVCEIPIPIVLSEGKYKDYSYLILSYISGDDIGKVYYKLNDSEKKQIAREVVEIQRKVSNVDISTDSEWSGIIDIDWMGFGDILTFVAMTRVALLNMDLDTRYIDHLLDEMQPNTMEHKAFVFYCLMFCVDFMGERGMQFLDKTIPVNESIIRRLNNIFDMLMEEWNKCCER